MFSHILLNFVLLLKVIWQPQINFQKFLVVFYNHCVVHITQSANSSRVLNIQSDGAFDEIMISTSILPGMSLCLLPFITVYY